MTAFSWMPELTVPELQFGKGRAPRMTVWKWRPTQGCEIGANDDGWYRRCKRPGCRIWAGPYSHSFDAVYDGQDHLHLAHGRWPQS